MQEGTDKDNINLVFDIGGYQNNDDPTATKQNFLVPPSQNVLVTGDDIQCVESRSGWTLLGNVRKNLEITVLYGTFLLGEQVIGQTSGAVGLIVAILSSTLVEVAVISGVFVSGETILGTASGATANINAITVPILNAIRSKHDTFVNALGVKLVVREVKEATGRYHLEVFYAGDWQLLYGLTQYPHEISFTEWYNDDLTIPMLLWVGGHKFAGFSDINYWYGGISTVAGFTSNTIDLDDNIDQLGFTPVGGVYINGVLFSYTGFSGTQFTGVTPDPTLSIAIGMVATAPIITDQLNQFGVALTNVPSLDIVQTLDNHIFYFSYETRVDYVSNSQSQESIQRLTTTNTTLDDIFITGNYGGNILNDIKIEITAIAPPLEIQEYIGTGNGLNDALYITSAYSGAAGVTNVYKLIVVGDFTIIINVASTALIEGEAIVGTTSQATGRIVKKVPNGGGTELGIIILSGVFQAGETITGQSTGTAEVIFGCIYQNWVQLFKNDNLQTITAGPITDTTVPLFSGGTLVLIDGLTISFDNYYGHALGDTFKLTIRAGKPDQYIWYTLDPVSGNYINPQGPFDINPASSPLTDGTIFPGVSISWQSATNNLPYGHAVGNFWTIHFEPSIRSPWSDVFYSLPQRKPGQGGLVKLDSPPVFAKVQESELHVGSRSGMITVLSFQASADLLTEAIIAKRIKTAISNKSLRQSLTTNTKNDIYYINVENQLVSLGRVENIYQTQMSEVISQPIKNDFFKSKFVVSRDGLNNGHVDWADNKVFVCVPDDGKWYMYEQYYDFWQPPQTGNFSSVSVINGQICAHSAISDETFVLFNASNDNGYPFTAIAAFAYTPAGNRSRLKATSQLFIEAYKTENTNLYGKVNLEWGNCKGGPDERLDPKVCSPVDRASLGKAPFAKHGLANDPVDGLLKFRYILAWNEKFVYEYQPIIYSDSIDLYFKIVSHGVNAMTQDQRNVDIMKPAKSPIVPSYPGVPGNPKILPEAGGTNLPDDVALATFIGGGS